MKMLDPIKFFSLLKWIDGRPLIEAVEPYRQAIFAQALYTLNDKGIPQYNLVLTGRAKKNWKSADLILAALYKLHAWDSPLGNQCYLLANDQGQAGDDLELAKKIYRINPVLNREVIIKKDCIERRDGKGFLEILPAQDVAGAHGKTYLFCGFDEIHEYRDWGLFEAMALDPHRPDAMMWIATYASLYNYSGMPLHDLLQQGKKGEDKRMFFSWYSGDYSTDPEYAGKETPEERANPSILPEGYLEQQKRRLPIHRYRRLHLNIGGSPEGAYLSPEKVEAAVGDYRSLSYQAGTYYRAFVDMSGGSGDDATLAISRQEGDRIIVDGVWTQGKRPPFDPREAVRLFAGILKGYAIFRVSGDRYAGETFRADFQGEGVTYDVCPVPKSMLYETLEVELNSGRVTLPDDVKLLQQLLTLVMKGGKIDHPSGEHDDLANAIAGATYLCRTYAQGVGEAFSYDRVIPSWQELESHYESDYDPAGWE